MIRVDVKVDTCFGHGTAVGKESFFEGRCVRWIVKLQDRGRWACSSITDNDPAFRAEELRILEDSEEMEKPRDAPVTQPLQHSGAQQRQQAIGTDPT